MEIFDPCKNLGGDVMLNLYRSTVMTLMYRATDVWLYLATNVLTLFLSSNVVIVLRSTMNTKLLMLCVDMC